MPKHGCLMVLKERCPQDHPCPSVAICPVEALVQVGHEAPTVLTERCICCGLCADFCPKEALMLR